MRSERWRNISEEFATAGTTTVVINRSGRVRSEPVTTGFALRIDALHREAGQILHAAPPGGRSYSEQKKRSFRAPLTGAFGDQKTRNLARIVPRSFCGVKRKDTRYRGGIAQLVPNRKQLGSLVRKNCESPRPSRTRTGVGGHDKPPQPRGKRGSQQLADSPPARGHKHRLRLA